MHFNVLFPSPDDRYFELTGAIAATLWIAAAITLQNMRSAVTSATFADDPKTDAENKIGLWYWIAHVAALVSQCFAVAVFWSLLWLLPTPYNWLFRLVAIVSLVRHLQRPTYRRSTWDDLAKIISHNTVSVVRDYVGNLLSDTELLAYTYLLGASYVVTALWPNPFVLAIIVFACIAMGINVVFIALSFTSSLGSIQRQQLATMALDRANDQEQEPTHEREVD